MTAPLTPADCDLRDYPWMPVDCTRLLTSETWMLGTAEQKVAAFTLWAKSWHQVPAGSLPAHDRMLEVLSEAGGAWKRVREHALRGWVLCSDGRLYHPVVCEKANESHRLRLAQKARTEAARAAKAARRGAPMDDPPRPVTIAVTDDAKESAAPTSTVDNVEVGSVVSVTGMYPDREFRRTEYETTACGIPQPIENGRSRLLSQTTLQAPPDQTRPDHKEERKNLSSLLSIPREREEASRAPEAEPPWNPSAVTAAVDVLTAKLEGRHRDTRMPGPVAAVRTPDEQIARLVPQPPRSKPAPAEVLAAARAALAARAAGGATGRPAHEAERT